MGNRYDAERTRKASTASDGDHGEAVTLGQVDVMEVEGTAQGAGAGAGAGVGAGSEQGAGAVGGATTAEAGGAAGGGVDDEDYEDARDELVRQASTATAEEVGDVVSMERERSLSAVSMHHRDSVTSMDASAKDKAAAASAMTEEAQDKGSVGLSVYSRYVEVAGGCWTAFITILLVLLAQAALTGSEVWLVSERVCAWECVCGCVWGPYAHVLWLSCLWSGGVDGGLAGLDATAVLGWLLGLGLGADGVPGYRHCLCRPCWLASITPPGQCCLACLLACHDVCTCTSQVSGLTQRACSPQQHRRMLQGVLRSPMTFFDITPTGRILNRVSKDLTTVDQVLAEQIKQVLVQ